MTNLLFCVTSTKFQPLFNND